MTIDLMATPEFTRTATGIRCPGCGSTHTSRVSTRAQDNLLCKTCGSCWHPVTGGAERISLRQCPGCSLRRFCLAAAG